MVVPLPGNPRLRWPGLSKYSLRAWLMIYSFEELLHATPWFAAASRRQADSPPLVAVSYVRAWILVSALTTRERLAATLLPGRFFQI